jgi:hypothetical protein
MMATIGEGGCACGTVRYCVDAEPLFVNNCFCTLCQRQTGSGSAVNAFVESEHIHLLSGEMTQNHLMTGSGGQQTILRCTACGTALWSHFPRLGAHGAGIKVGTLDNPAALRPDAAIFVAYRAPWAALPEGVPAFDETYRPADLLPPERMARLRALAAKAAS